MAPQFTPSAKLLLNQLKSDSVGLIYPEGLKAWARREKIANPYSALKELEGLGVAKIQEKENDRPPRVKATNKAWEVKI